MCMRTSELCVRMRGRRREIWMRKHIYDARKIGLFYLNPAEQVGRSMPNEKYTVRSLPPASTTRHFPEIIYTPESELCGEYLMDISGTPGLVYEWRCSIFRHLIRKMKRKKNRRRKCDTVCYSVCFACRGGFRNEYVLRSECTFTDHKIGYLK